MKQKELGDKLGRTAMEIGRARKKVCSNLDYDESTKELTEEGVKKITDYLDDSVIQPQFVKVRVLQDANNPRFLICRTMEGKNSKKARVAIPANIKKSLGAGSVFKAQVIDFRGENFYRHERLMNANFPPVFKKA